MDLDVGVNMDISISLLDQRMVVSVSVCVSNLVPYRKKTFSMANGTLTKTDHIVDDKV